METFYDPTAFHYDGVVQVSLVFFILLAGGVSFADPTPPSWDVDRRAGFAEHQRFQRVYDREREKGQTAYLEELEDWERSRKAALQEHKKVVKRLSPQEHGPEHREDLSEKRKYAQEMDKARREYLQLRKKILSGKRQAYAQSEEVELGLASDGRPRYDLKRRVLYGARGKFKGQTGMGRFGGSGSSGGSGGSNFPPPPNFDDFPPPPSNDYIPPPLEEEYPPPPPPPAFDEGDFPPPPPPPPIPDFGDFPPPPAPFPPEGF